MLRWHLAESLPPEESWSGAFARLGAAEDTERTPRCGGEMSSFSGLTKESRRTEMAGTSAGLKIGRKLSRQYKITVWVTSDISRQA